MMRLATFILSMMLVTASVAQKKKANTIYFPPAGEWEERAASSLGLSQAAIDSAVAFSIAHESSNPRSMEVNHYQTFGREPFGEATGPLADRGLQTGLIIYKGYIVAKWGEPLRCDMTHSVTKSFLSSIVGVAVDSGLIRSVFDTVYPYIPPIEVYNPGYVQRPADQYGTEQLLHPFSTAHNREIRWDDLLRQTSDWEGILWGKPEWADRPDKDPATWTTRARVKPGTVFEYNDVRVNVLALAATSVWRKPLPQVLKTYIMDPIGASNTWRWAGYRNAWIVLDGQPVQSVSGGGHWGGGMFINAYDMARFGLLTLHRGVWNGRRLLSENWVKMSLTPTRAQKNYGFMNWYLNTDRELLPHAPASAFMHIGNGNNIVYVDPEHDLVMVSRWIDNKSMDGLIEKLLQALPR
jgi:Beta-lactamase